MFLNSSNGKDVLDIACGSGLMPKALQDGEKDDMEFIRKYHRSADKIRFHTILKAGEVLENDEFLLPVTYDIMVGIIKEEEFDFKFFGIFDEEEFDKEKSIPLILGLELRGKYG